MYNCSLCGLPKTGSRVVWRELRSDNTIRREIPVCLRCEGMLKKGVKPELVKKLTMQNLLEVSHG